MSDSGEAQVLSSTSNIDAEDIPRTTPLEEAWSTMMARVRKYDDGKVKDWKEDIDTLLVFAGLFSAVVTAFTVESYQKLSEDPMDKTVAILTQISLQLAQPNNSSTTVPISAKSTFVPSPSFVRINAFWFLSIVMSLTSSLFGLLGKQWLREYARDTHTPTPKEALTLRHLREKNFREWNVPAILNMLPFILQLALLLFFAGLVEFLWNLENNSVFVVGAIGVGLTCSVYAVTTILPALTVIQSVLRPLTNLDNLHDNICPYKSPQAWGVLWLATYAVKIACLFNKWTRQLALKITATHRTTQSNVVLLRQKLERLKEWSSLDESRFRISSYLSNAKLKYELEAVRWLVTVFRDTPSAYPQIIEVLTEDLPYDGSGLILFEYQSVFLWKGQPSKTQPWLNSLLATTGGVLDTSPFHTLGLPHLYSSFQEIPSFGWSHLESSQNIGQFTVDYDGAPWLDKEPPDMETKLAEIISNAYSISERNVPYETQIYFTLPWFAIDNMLENSKPWYRKAGLKFLSIYRAEWEKISILLSEMEQDRDGYAIVDHRFALIISLTFHLMNQLPDDNEQPLDPDADPANSTKVSALLTDPVGLQFLTFISNEIIDQELRRRAEYPEKAANSSTYGYWEDLAHNRHAILDIWGATLKRVQNFRHLPSDYFRPIPSREEIVSDGLQHDQPDCLARLQSNVHAQETPPLRSRWSRLKTLIRARTAWEPQESPDGGVGSQQA